MPMEYGSTKYLSYQGYLKEKSFAKNNRQTYNNDK